MRGDTNFKGSALSDPFVYKTDIWANNVFVDFSNGRNRHASFKISYKFFKTLYNSPMQN